MNTKPILLVDGHNLLFRMFYGIQNSIKNSNGIEIKGLIGFVGSIKKLALEFEPYSIVVVFDSETSRCNNDKIDENYKANRKDYNNVEESDNPFSQLPFIKLALDYLNITNFEVSDNEADDYIASIVKKRNDERFVIVSTDTDFLQNDLFSFQIYLIAKIEDTDNSIEIKGVFTREDFNKQMKKEKPKAIYLFEDLVKTRTYEYENQMTELEKLRGNKPLQIYGICENENEVPRFQVVVPS